MQLIIVGCGKVGSKFAQVMSAEGHDVVIIDNDSDSFKILDPEFTGITITGIPIDQDVLKRAGIETADALAAVTPDDNINIMTCQVAKEIFKVPNVIARIYDPAREQVFHQFGLDTICPTNLTVEVIKARILNEAGAGVCEHNIAGNCFNFKFLRAEESDNGKYLNAIKVNQGEMIFGIVQDKEFKFAQNDIMLQKNDIIVLVEVKK